MKILLLGLMGSGKTTIGKLLAKTLGCEFVEMDALVLQHSGFDSVQDVFELRESLWQESELEVSKQLSNQQNSLVIACSGDIVENQLNIQYFRENSANMHVIYLQTTPETLAKRVIASHVEKLTIEQHDSVEKNIMELNVMRHDSYKKMADTVIKTDIHSLEEIIEEIKAVIIK